MLSSLRPSCHHSFLKTLIPLSWGFFFSFCNHIHFYHSHKSNKVNIGEVYKNLLFINFPWIPFAQRRNKVWKLFSGSMSPSGLEPININMKKQLMVWTWWFDFVADNVICFILFLGRKIGTKWWLVLQERQIYRDLGTLLVFLLLGSIHSIPTGVGSNRRMK